MNQNYNGKTKEIPKPIGCLLLVGFFGVILMFFMPFINVGIEIYKDLPTRGKVVFLGIILILICRIAFKIRKLYRLNKAIESGSAIRKKAKIIDFQFAENGGGGENDTSKGYYVVVFDGENDYDGMFHRGARIIGKLEEEIKKDKFYEESGIPLDLKNRDITKKQLDARIEELKLKQKEASFFEKGKIGVKIGELKNKKNDLEPYHLHTREGDFYIGDEYTILIDPEDPSNYTFESGNV